MGNTKRTRHYDHAAIAEAIIDLRVEWPATAPADVLDRLAAQLADRLPKNSPLGTISMGFQKQVGQEPKFITDAQTVGVRLESASGDRVLQLQHGGVAGITGFTYSHLPLYSDWCTFSAEAIDLWRAFIDAVGIKTVTRAAVRVINKIVLPGSLQDVMKYTSLHPQIPGGVASANDAYFLQLQSTGAVEGSRVIINSGRIRLPDGKYEFLLDFDLFADRNFDAHSPDIWSLLERLSNAKNELFEACITDDFRKMIQ